MTSSMCFHSSRCFRKISLSRSLPTQLMNIQVTRKSPCVNARGIIPPAAQQVLAMLICLLIWGGGRVLSQWGVLHPVLEGVPVSSPGWEGWTGRGGVLNRGYPSSLNLGVAPTLILDGVSPIWTWDGGTPHQHDGIPPSGPGMGYSLVQTWDGVPPVQTWEGVPSHPDLG